jgi:hypothetical protein
MGERELEQRRELRGEGLGGCHADFHAGAGDVGQRAFAHHGRGGDVADGERVPHAQRLRMAQRGQGVGRLAALADDDHQRARVRHAGAVAVFAGDFHVAGHAGQGLEPVARDAAAVVAGAAGEDEHAICLAEHAVGAVAEELGRDALDAFEGVGDGARLLEDFLLHVVPVRSELGCAAVRLHGAHRTLGDAAVGAVDAPAAQLQVGDVALLQVDDAVGHASQGHGVAGEEGFTALGADAQHQRRAGARAHHAVRLVAVQHGDGVGAAQLLHGGLHGAEQVAVVEAVDEVGDDLGVGLAGEVVAACAQALAQLVVVFDDAVVHQRHARRGLRRLRAEAGADVWVGVGLGRRAVRGPAGVRNAGAGHKSLGLHLGLQIGHARGAARAPQARPRRAAEAGRMHGDAAGVVAAVFEPLQALHEDGNDVARGDCADDAAHGSFSWKGVGVMR